MANTAIAQSKAAKVAASALVACLVFAGWVMTRPDPVEHLMTCQIRAMDGPFVVDHYGVGEPGLPQSFQDGLSALADLLAGGEVSVQTTETGLEMGLALRAGVTLGDLRGALLSTAVAGPMDRSSRAWVKISGTFDTAEVSLTLVGDRLIVDGALRDPESHVNVDGRFPASGPLGFLGFGSDEVDRTLIEWPAGQTVIARWEQAPRGRGSLSVETLAFSSHQDASYQVSLSLLGC